MRLHKFDAVSQLTKNFASPNYCAQFAVENKDLLFSSSGNEMSNTCAAYDRPFLRKTKEWQ